MHLSDSEIIKFVKGYYDEGTVLDENNEIKSDFKDLSSRVYGHTSECIDCKKRLNEIKEKFLNNKDIASETIKELEESINKDNSNIIENVGETMPIFSSYDNSFGIDKQTEEQYKQQPNDFTPAQERALNVGGRQKTLVLPDSKGFADALVLALITGFAGGLFVSVILMLCK